MKKIKGMGSAEWEYCRECFGEDCIEEDRGKKTEEILDFANMVFSMEYSGTDFASLLPKAYSPKRCGIPIHHMIKEEDRIRALIDIYPFLMKLRGKDSSTIKAAYVGTVAVHPNSRGRGYMIELMRRAEEDARKLGCALMILDGDRHRYLHYGFERAGIRYSFHIGTGNIKHCCANIYNKGYMESPAYRFEELAEHSPYLDRLYQLYQQRIVTARSREDFWLCLRSYHASAYAVLRDGEPAGYVSLSGDMENISEIEIDVGSELCRVLYDLMTEFGMEQLGVSVGMDEEDKIRALEGACDYCNASMSHQLKILDYEAVLTFLMNWKQSYGTPAMGDYVLGIRNCGTDDGENYLLSVTAGKISVSRTQKAADAVLDPPEFVRVLTTSLYYVEQQKGGRGKIKNVPAGWFPLPFYLPEADTF